MRYRDLQDCAGALLAMLDAVPGSGSQTGAESPAEGLDINNNIYYVNQKEGVAGIVAGAAAEATAPAAVPLAAMTETAQLVSRPAAEGSLAPAVPGRAGLGSETLRDAGAPGIPAGGWAGAVADQTVDMEDIDRFFRRDSRRYDSGFGET